MTPQELKNSILQLAIQGKLVEQRPEEGTGEELYRQIQTEKKRLIKEGKIKKDKPLPEIAEDEIPFDIPESWKWVRFSEIMSTMSTGPFGSMLHKTDYIEKGIPLVNPANMVNGKIVPSDKMMISEATRRRLSSYILHAGMIVLGRRGEMGRCAVVTEKEDGWLCGTGSFFMEPSMSLYVYYVASLFSSPYVKFYLGGESVGTTMSNLNHTILSKMPIPLPPLSEQKRIVAKIEELLPYIDRYAASYERLEQVNTEFPEDMKKSILQYAIQGKLVEQRAEEGTGEELYRQIQEEKKRLIKEGKIKKEKPLPEIAEDEKPYDIPDNWTWVRFGDLGSYKKGPFGSAITKSMFVPKGNGAIKVYEQKNAIQKDATLGDYYIRRDYFESKMKGFEVFPGDIIVSCAGTIGETYVMPDKFEQGIINQALMRMKIFEPLYIPYFLTFFDFVLKKNARSGSKGSAIKNIPPFEILKNYLVPIPPLAEQKRIVAKLEEILPLCERLK